MDIFLKITSGVMTALILWLCVNKYMKDMSLLLTLTVSAMAVIATGVFLRPIVDFFRHLQQIGNLDRDLLSVILKAVGIGLLSELCVLICTDAGNATMGKTLQIVSGAVILWMSIPVFEKLLSLLDTILGTV